MKRQLITAALFTTLSAMSSLASTPAQAANRSVESALAGYDDVSLFYQALLNTGVINELNENTRYTVFAPTNEAFADIQPRLYPCFYSIQCRAQVADVVRDHIVVGRRSLKELVREGEVPTIGRFHVYAESPYVGDYALGGHKVLSSAEVRGNMIDRIDGVIITEQQLASFRAIPPLASGVTQEKTITTYHTSTGYPVPAGGYSVNPVQTVTERTYVAPGIPQAGTVVYPDGTQTTTVEHSYAAPGEEETTTVTRTY